MKTYRVKEKKMKKTLPIFAFLILFTCTGCWNYTELNDLAVVTAIALDKAEEPGKIELTAQIMRPSLIKSPSASKKGTQTATPQEPYFNVSQIGSTVFEAVRESANTVNRELYLPLIQVIIIGQTLAEEDVSRYLEYFLHEHEVRMNVNIIYAKGKAKDILKIQPDFDKIPSIYIKKLADNQTASSKNAIVTLLDFTNTLLSKTISPIVPIIEAINREGVSIARFGGTAVFKKGKFIGELNESQTRGMLWVINKIDRGVIDVDNPGGDGKASLEIIRSNTAVEVENIKGTVLINIKIREEGNLGSQTGKIDFTKMDNWIILEKKQEAVIKEEVLNAFKKAKDLNCDIFGFSEAIHRKNPTLWKTMEKNWDKIFPDIQLNVIVEAKLRRPGMIIKPLKPE